MPVTETNYPVKPKGFIGVFQTLPQDITLEDGDYAIVNNNLMVNMNGTIETLSFKGTTIYGEGLSTPTNGDLVAEVQSSSATVPPYNVIYKNYDGTAWEVYAGPVMNLIDNVNEDGNENE